MSTTSKNVTTIYGVHTSNDEQHDSSKLDCTTKKITDDHSNQQKVIKDEKAASKYKMTHNLYCLEGFIFGNHD